MIYLFSTEMTNDPINVSFDRRPTFKRPNVTDDLLLSGWRKIIESPLRVLVLPQSGNQLRRRSDLARVRVELDLDARLVTDLQARIFKHGAIDVQPPRAAVPN